MRAITFTIVIFAISPVYANELTCEGNELRAHCFDHHGYLSTEERSGEYVHGYDNQGNSWTIWNHDGRTTIFNKEKR